MCRSWEPGAGVLSALSAGSTSESHGLTGRTGSIHHKGMLHRESLGTASAGWEIVPTWHEELSSCAGRLSLCSGCGLEGSWDVVTVCALHSWFCAWKAVLKILVNAVAVSCALPDPQNTGLECLVCWCLGSKSSSSLDTSQAHLDRFCVCSG